MLLLLVLCPLSFLAGFIWAGLLYQRRLRSYIATHQRILSTLTFSERESLRQP